MKRSLLTSNLINPNLIDHEYIERFFYSIENSCKFFYKSMIGKFG